MNFTQRVANLLIWLWTSYVLPALNALKGRIDTLTTTVANNYNTLTTTINDLTVQTAQNLSDTTEQINQQIQQVDANISNAYQAADAAISSSLTTFQTSTNSTLASLQNTVSQISSTVSGAVLGFIALDTLQPNFEGGTLRLKKSGLIELDNAANGRYLVYVSQEDANSENYTDDTVLKIYDTEDFDTVAFNLGAFDINDSIDIVVAGGSITSARVVKNADPILNEDAVKAIVQAEITAFSAN